ncbi:UDP-2,3-diacylglucosamine diphosphatase [Candidatus Thioglobus sp.]|uniref:UDP-2,3-diacylglucosamine diphosphatase n=1 Tax=Candidatus Pseudothioglobus sp. Uisw_086 TaxID=3230998 RepID=UPI00236E4AC9|nr:UDP-2,3-diacylglucosamine diphosphatase [Candidatus Thioglobus sp.]
MLTSLIISDLHLTNVEDDKVIFFNQFCEDHASKADQLFILGDLFNSWLGDDVSISSHNTIISSLKELTKETKVFVMAGNRDFLLSHNFEAETGCILINEPYELEHNTKKFLLIHGDSLCTDDINYQKLKKVLRNPIVQYIFLHLPKNIRLKLTGQLRKKSVEAQSYKSSKIMDVNQQTTDLLMSEYPGYELIHGHTHRQKTHTMKNYTRYVLGDWSKNKGNAIKLSDNLEWLEIN